MKPSLFRNPLQPVREQFGGVLTCYRASKTQPTLAEDALVRIGAQEALHHHCNPGRVGFTRISISSASQTFGSSVPRLRLAKRSTAPF